jgi:ubiquinone/menaquinone biosynthesis C-methylase UbiE
MRIRRGHGHDHRRNAFTGGRALRYNTTAAGGMRWLYRGLAQDIVGALPHGARVLDVGTGPGVLLAELARSRPDVELVGVDLSPDMAALAAWHLAPYGHRARALVGDVAALPLSGRSVDIVVSSLSMHHWADLDSAVTELARVLRPGGAVRIYDVWRAPFGKLVAAAGAQAVFAGRAPHRKRIRVGWLPLPVLTRLVLTP